MFDVKELERIITENQSKTIEVNGKTFVFGKCAEVKPPKFHASKISFNELSSIVTMIKQDADPARKLYVHIDSPYSVEVFTDTDSELERDYLYSSNFSGKQFSFGNWLDFENFVISLRAKFVENEERDKLIQLIASITSVDDNKIEDNGITQSATTKQGASFNSFGEIKAIYRLSPYRTFGEVEQVSSEYLFRISTRSDKSLAFALFEADGGQWQLAQKEIISDYFFENLEDEISTGRVTIVR